MDEFEDAFRSALSRIDAAPRPVATLEPAVAVARARAVTAPSLRSRMIRRLALVAALVVVAGIGLAGWLGRGNAALPAFPAPSPTLAEQGQLVIGPLVSEPASDFSLVVDDSALVGYAPLAGQPGIELEQVPGSYFVHDGAVYVDDQAGGRIATYRDGRRVDSVLLPDGAPRYSAIAVWEGTYYLMTDRLRAYTRQGGRLVETSLPDDLAGASDLRGLIVEDGSLVAVHRSGPRRLVAGPGPLQPARVPSLTTDAALIKDGRVDARIELDHEPVWVGLLGRDSVHVWYQVCEAWQGSQPGNQCHVVEFDTRGRFTASYNPDVGDGFDFWGDLGVGDGQVYQLKQTDRSIQVRRLRPTPPRPEPTQPAAVTLPDGKHFGFVRHFDGQAIYLDPAELFSNEEAVEAAREDGEDPNLPNPFYLRNREEEVVRLPVSDQFGVKVIDGSNYPDVRTLSGAEFAQLYRPGADASWMYSPPDRLAVDFEVSNSQVVSAVERYLP